jgi:hypothetical protein
MPKSITTWLLAGLIGIAVLPWYGLDSYIAIDWLARYPDLETGPALYQITRGGRTWLVLPLFPLIGMAGLMLWCRRTAATVKGLPGLALLGIVLFLLQGFAIIHTGPALSALAAWLPGDSKQPGMGYGALLLGFSYLMLLSEGLARRGYCRGDSFVVGTLSLIIALVGTFVFFPLFGFTPTISAHARAALQGEASTPTTPIAVGDSGSTPCVSVRLFDATTNALIQTVTLAKQPANPQNPTAPVQWDNTATPASFTMPSSDNVYVQPFLSDCNGNGQVYDDSTNTGMLMINNHPSSDPTVGSGSAPQLNSAGVTATSNTAACGPPSFPNGTQYFSAGETMDFSSKEFELLKYFLCHPGETLSRDRLLEDVWGYDRFPTTRTVDAHIVRLRQKVEPKPDEPRFILTVHGTGYKFVG